MTDSQIKLQNHAIREFRIVLPMSVEDYHVGQLWSVAEASKNETGGGDGVEVLVNEPFDEKTHKPDTPLVAKGRPPFTTGQYTHKIYHLSQKVPGFIRILAPRGSLEVHERAWNAYPYCRTVITNPYMKDNFYIIIETFHAPDHGNSDNIHGLTGRDLSERKVVLIDVANDKIPAKDYKEEWDPCVVKCPKSGRAQPLPRDKNGAWMKAANPVMCCYKLVKVWFKWFGLQKKMESFILVQEQRLFLNFHRQVVCWQDNYHGMTMDDIRRIEEQTRNELEKQRVEMPLRGMTATDDDGNKK